MRRMTRSANLTTPFRLGLLVAALLAVACAEKLKNGLEINVTKAVDCDEKTKGGDMVEMHYTGTLANGDVFDSSRERDEPLEFRLGSHMVIAGWDQGLLDMCIGEERTLVIPPALAYGSSGMGPIPPDSTLTFETQLVSINGKTDAERPSASSSTSSSTPSSTSSSTPSSTSSSTPSSTSSSTPSSISSSTPSSTSSSTPSSTPFSTLDNGDSEPMTDKEKAIQEHSSQSSADSGIAADNVTSIRVEGHDEQPGAENGECRLLGPFALLVQAGLGVLALFSLVWKRQRERPRRPVRVWLFDVSKQVFGSVLLHLLNLLMSEIPASKGYELASKAKDIQDDTGRQPNPCSFYLINIAVDTTIGVPILIILLKVLTRGAAFTPLARPPESIKSGNYGQPPQASWWMKQSLVYFVALLLMKLCVFFIFSLLPWIALVGDWALRWTEDREDLQIAFTMFVFPLIMNALQYYIIDSFIKDRTGEEHESGGTNGEHDEDESRPLRGDDDDESAALPPEHASTEPKIRTTKPLVVKSAESTKAKAK